MQEILQETLSGFLRTQQGPKPAESGRGRRSKPLAAYPWLQLWEALLMRPHHPWFRAANNSWYVEVGGQQHFLGKHPEEAPPPRKRKRGDPPPRPPQAIEQAYHRLMATAERKLPQADTVRVATVCDLFLDFSEKHHAEGTYRGYRDYLQDFCELYGSLLAKDLNPNYSRPRSGNEFK